MAFFGVVFCILIFSSLLANSSHDLLSSYAISDKKCKAKVNIKKCKAKVICITTLVFSLVTFYMNIICFSSLSMIN